jgi:phosphinothricin acetyltransferase
MDASIATIVRQPRSRAARAADVASAIGSASGYHSVELYDVVAGGVALLLGSAGEPVRDRPSSPAGGDAASELVLPIVEANGRVVGTLRVASAERDALGERDVASLAAVAREVVPLFCETTVRTAHASDAPAFAAIYAPFVSASAVSFEDEPPGESEMRRRVVATLERTPWLAATNGSEITGYAYASRHRDRSAYRWAVDVSAYVQERLRGRGVGRALYGALLAVLERQGFRRAYAGITLPNDASVALHRSAGFEPIGIYRRVGWKLGAWHDVAWFGRTLGIDDDELPPEPLPFVSMA